jgi:hypothetical protein
VYIARACIPADAVVDVTFIEFLHPEKFAAEIIPVRAGSFVLAAAQAAGLRQQRYGVSGGSRISSQKPGILSFKWLARLEEYEVQVAKK